jgi:hypothetical protein
VGWSVVGRPPSASPHLEYRARRIDSRNRADDARWIGTCQPRGFSNMGRALRNRRPSLRSTVSRRLSCEIFVS